MAEEQPSAAQDDIQIKTEPEDVDPCNENDFAKGPHLAPSGVKCAGTSPATSQSGMNEDNGDKVVGSPRTNQSGMNEDIGEVVMNLKDDVSIDDPGRTTLQEKEEDICDSRIEQKNLRIRPVRVVLVDLIYKQQAKKVLNTNLPMAKDGVSADDPERTTLQEKEEDICDSRIEQKDLRIQPVTCRIVMVDLYKQLAKKGLNANKYGGHTGWSSNRLRSRLQMQSRTNYTEISSDEDEAEVEGEDKDSDYQEFSSKKDEDMDEDVDSVDSSFDELDPGSDSVDQKRNKQFYQGLIRLQALGRFTKFPAETLNKMVKQGSSKYSMVCTICNKEWKVMKIEVIASHVQAHAGARKFLCLKCGRYFKSKKMYDVHCELHLRGIWRGNDEPGSRQHTCQTCYRIFPSHTALICHMKTHRNEDKPWRCGCCEKMFRLRQLYVMTMRWYTRDCKIENINVLSVIKHSRANKHILNIYGEKSTSVATLALRNIPPVDVLQRWGK